MLRFLCLVLALVLAAAYGNDTGYLTLSSDQTSWLVLAGWATLALIVLTLGLRFVGLIVKRVGQAMDQRDDSLAQKIGTEVRKTDAATA